LTKPVRLSRRGGELLLRLLERSRPVIAAAALEELPSEGRSTLINVGALERHGAGRAALVAGDDGPTFRDLAWRADQNAYGYFDTSDGSVVVAPEAQMLFRVALPWWLAWLTASLALTNSGQPTELVPSSAWDIGDLWTRQRNIPILFVRQWSTTTLEGQYDRLPAMAVDLIRRAGDRARRVRFIHGPGMGRFRQVRRGRGGVLPGRRPGGPLAAYPIFLAGSLRVKLWRINTP
jgi:hypothetical protein